jgi:hypothetical protein
MAAQLHCRHLPASTATNVQDGTETTARRKEDFLTVCSSDDHMTQLRCPDDLSGDMCERGVPGGVLNLNSTSYPDRGRYGNLL